MTIRLATASICAVAGLLAGCGGSTKPSSATECNPPTGARAVEATAHPDETALLTAVSVESDACVDRVEFAFESDGGASPGYRVSYHPADTALIEDGSGSPVAVAGSAYLVVRFEPAATADVSGPELVRTYRGPKRIAAPENTHALREVVKSGDFEAVLTWVIGLDGRRPFAVTKSADGVVVTVG
jgi:hypothetical protein